MVRLWRVLPEPLITLLPLLEAPLYDNPHYDNLEVGDVALSPGVEPCSLSG